MVIFFCRASLLLMVCTGIDRETVTAIHQFDIIRFEVGCYNDFYEVKFVS